MQRNPRHSKDASLLIDAMYEGVAETMLDRVSIVDSEGLFTATTRRWDSFIQHGGDSVLRGAAAGRSLVDHLHRSATAGSVYARDALVLLLAVIQGARQYGVLEYSPGTPGHVWRHRLTICHLSESPGGALVTHSTVQRGNYGVAALPLLQALAQSFGAQYAAVCKLVEKDPPTLRVLAQWDDDGGTSTDLTALPAIGPWAELLNEGYTAHRTQVQEAFPDDEWLRSRNAEGFAGVVLRDGSEAPIGMLAVVGRDPLNPDLPIEILLQAVAARLGSVVELEEIRDVTGDGAALLFRAVFEACPESILIFSLDGSLLEMNSAARDFLQYPPAAPPDIDLSRLVGSADAEKMWNDLTAHGVWKSEKTIIRGQNDERIPALIDVRRIDLPTRTALEAVVHHVGDEISATPGSADATRRDRALLAALPDAVFRMTADGVCVDYSPGKVTLLYSPDSPIGRSLDEMLPAGLATAIRAMIARALETHETQGSEFRLDVEGSTHFREVRVVPATDTDTLLILRDLTAERSEALERELREKMQEVEGKAEYQMIRHNPYGLTFRELSVLYLVADGLADKEIARRLGVSIFTVNKHVAKVLEKMGASSRTEAAVRAGRENLLL